MLCGKSLVCSHSQSLYWNAKEVKPQSGMGSSTLAEKGTSLWFTVWILACSGAAFMDVVPCWGYRCPSELDLPGKGGSAFADWAVFTLVSDGMIM